MSAEAAAPKPPSLIRNYISFVGAAITIAALVSTFLLFLMEVTSRVEHPYLGILTYIVFPAILIFGIGIVILGMVLERRRRRRASPGEVLAYPRLDLNDAHARVLVRGAKPALARPEIGLALAQEA